MLQKETLEAKLSAVKTEFAQLQALNPDINYYEHYPLAGPSKKNRNSYSYNSLPQVKSAGGPVAEDADGRNRQRSFRRLFKSLNKKEVETEKNTGSVVSPNHFKSGIRSP